jgi:hypothetical protein
MTVIGDAIEAANSRKLAAGIPDTTDEGLVFTQGQFTDRAVFSGFDIDYDELVSVIETVGAFFTTQACGAHPLIPLFRAAWTDGFLTGLMVKQNVAPHHDPPGYGEPNAGPGGTESRGE